MRWFGTPCALLTLVLAGLLLAGCAMLGGGHPHSKPAADAQQFKATPGVRQGGDQQRLSAALNAIYADAGNTQALRYYSKFIDLNGDGQRDAVAFVVGPDQCVTGCDLYLFTSDGDRYQVLSRIPSSKAPVYALSQRHHGWRDLLVSKPAVGGGSGHRQQLRHVQGGYVPVNDNPDEDQARTTLISSLDGPGHRLNTSQNGQSRPGD